MSAGDWEECRCGRGWFDPSEYNTCYTCCLERRESYVACIFCGRWHSPLYNTCYRCRASAPQHDRAGRDLRLDILIRDDFACRDCGSRQQPEIDHIKPCLEGGKATPWNLQVLCHDCNQVKGRTSGYGCGWDVTRVELMHLYFTFGWPMLDDEQRKALVADAHAYGDEFTRHTYFAGPKPELPAAWLAEADSYYPTELGEEVGDRHDYDLAT